MRKLTCFVLSIICLLWALEVPAQVDVELKAEVNQATVGDWIPVTLSATVPRGSEIVWPILEETLNPLVVLNIQEKNPVSRGDQDYQEVTATVAAYDTGKFEIPSLPVIVIPPGGGEGIEYFTAPRMIFIASVLPDSGYPNIVDIRSQVDVPISAWEIILKALVLVGIVGAGYGFYRLIVWWRRRKGELPIPGPPPIPPHELAYRELMELQEQKLLKDGKLSEYYFRLSEIIRRYLEGRYGFPALEMATWDIKQVLPEFIDKDKLHRRIEEWMDSGDMVKFAKDVPGWDDCEQALTFAYKIVDETK
ncbi:hypothetical protein AMJ86_06300, partial [bacterium SM23_57]